MLSLGLPKGRLLAHSRRILGRLGIHEEMMRKYRFTIPDKHAVARLVKMQDIPGLVQQGLLDIGVAPDEWIEECGGGVHRIASLGWYRARICLLVHRSSDYVKFGDPDWPTGSRPCRVVTEYPNLARNYLHSTYPNAQVLSIRGSAEAFLPDLADAIVDCVETGKTAEENGLDIIDVIQYCDVHVICRSVEHNIQDRSFRHIVDAIIAEATPHPLLTGPPPVVTEQRGAERGFFDEEGR
jgi:ATP phosphoribosyltransferase